jgi:hypothetical protein
MSNEIIIPTSHITPVPYKAGACAFLCFDQNFRDLSVKFLAYLEEKKGKWIDPVVIPGGAKNLGSLIHTDRACAFGFLDVSIHKHDVESFVFTTHAMCQAYGVVAECGGDPEAQLEFQRREHAVIDLMTRKRYPEFTGPIEHYYLSLDGVMKLDLWS